MFFKIDTLTVEDIESAIAQLEPKDYLRSGRSYQNSITEFSKIIAQGRKDKDALTASLFNMVVLDVFEAAYQKLVDAHAKRVALLGEKADIVVIFDERMPEMNEKKKVLGHVIQYLIGVLPDNKDILRTWGEVKKGFGDIDTLDDIVVCATAVEQYPDYYQKVAPAGVVIDADYLSTARAEAKEMIKKHGEATVASQESKKLLDRQRRLMTLCVAAERWVKLYANMAFMNNMDHYNQFYASPSIREMNSGSAEDEDGSTYMEAVDAEIEEMEASMMDEENKKDSAAE